MTNGCADQAPQSPSWLDDDADLFHVAETPTKFDPSLTSTQADVAPRVPQAFSPPRAGFGKLLKAQKTTQNPPPKPSPPIVAKPSRFSLAKVQPKHSPSPLAKPKLSENKRPSVASQILTQHPPSPAGISISPEFLKAINEACDTIQAMPLQKLITCFEGKITSITELLSAWSKHKETTTAAPREPPPQRLSASSSRQSALEVVNSDPPPFDDMYNDMDAWDDFEFSPEKVVPEPQPPPTSLSLQQPSTAKPVTLNLGPKVELISRPKPNEPKLEADTGEGNAFLPLSSNQSKWGRFVSFLC